MATNTNQFLSELNEEQRRMVLATDGPSLVVAGPGSGKTRALTRKIAYLILEKKVHPDEILAVTFTNKAAKEMKERVVALLKGEGDKPVGETVGYELMDHGPSWIGTFHSICARILRVEASKSILEYDRNFVIYDTGDQEKLIREVLVELDMNVRDVTPKTILGTISKAKSEMMTPAMFKMSSGRSYYFERVAQIYPAYQKKLRDNNALDFDDLLFEVAKLFENNKDVLDSYQQKFQYILIDEYQDTNMVQYKFVKLLAQKHKNLTVVGDVSQSIYSWRGANYRNMLQFEKDYPEAKIFHLPKNYRSTGNILKAAKTLIENNSTHIAIDLYTDNEIGDAIKLYEAEQEKAEAKFITDMISLLASPGSTFEEYPEDTLKNFAVLYRTNAQSRSIEEAFITAGIPYRIIGGVRFYDRKEIKDVLAYLKVFHNPKDTVSWGRCINTPPRGIGKKTLDKIITSGYDLDMVEELTKTPWKQYIHSKPDDKNTKPLATTIELLDAVLKDFGYLEYLNDGTEESLYRIENLKELRTVAAQMPNLAEFLETVALVESSSKVEKQNDNSVVLMTLHSAKGLEFETVFIVGMEEGLFPHSRSMTDPDELEEERRLCYVGITRAKKNLYMTYTRRRTYFGSTSSTVVSRFISEIPEELIEFRFG